MCFYATLHETRVLFVRQVVVFLGLFLVHGFFAPTLRAQGSITIPVKFWGDATNGSGGGQTQYYPWAQLNGVLIGANPLMGMPDFDHTTLELGKVYSLQYNGYNSLKVVAPPGYTVQMDNVNRTSYPVPQVPTGTCKVRILPAYTPNALPVGVATSLVGGRMYWEVSLGALKDRSECTI